MTFLTTTNVLGKIVKILFSTLYARSIGKRRASQSYTSQVLYRHVARSENLGGWSYTWGPKIILTSPQIIVQNGHEKVLHLLKPKVDSNFEFHSECRVGNCPPSFWQNRRHHRPVLGCQLSPWYVFPHIF